MKKLIVIISLISIVFSCKTIGIQNQVHNQVELATIGKEKNGLTRTEFQTHAIHSLTQKIRIGITFIPFTKNSFKTFKQANSKLGKNTNLSYIDSLPNKPKYITLNILDKVTLLNNLNNKENNKTFNYLKTASKQKMITEISLVFSDNTQRTLQEADEIYLIQNQHKKYALEVLTNKNQQVINLKEATVFNYETTSFCWGENDKHEIEIIDLTNKCTNNTYKTHSKALKKKGAFNFIKL